MSEPFSYANAAPKALIETFMESLQEPGSESFYARPRYYDIVLLSLKFETGIHFL